MKLKNSTLLLAALCAVQTTFSQASIVQVGCSEYRSFFLGDDNKVYASLWDNSIAASHATPYDFGGKGVVALRAALYYGLALDEDGYVWNLPNKSPNPTRTNTDYLGNPFNNVISFDGWYATNVAVKSDGTLWLWGGNDYNFSAAAAANPTPVNAPAGVKFKKVVCGKTLVALTTDGDVYEWTKGNTTPSKKTLPGAATDIVSGGQGFAVAVVDGWPYGWADLAGYIGLSGTVKTPTALKTTWGMSAPIVKITANYNAIHYIDANGDLWGMGDNAEGDVGNGEELVNHAELYPTPYVWGWDPYGLMVTKPVHIAQGIKFKDIFAGSSYAFYHYAIDTKGNVYSWGRNKSNDLGNGITVNNESAYPNALDVLKPTLVTPMTVLSRGHDFAPYTINPGPAQTITLPTNLVKMAGSATPATGYTIASYKWTQVSGPSTANIKDPSSPTTEINGLAAGTYVFNLQMTDNNTATISGKVTITVKPGGPSNQSPVSKPGDAQKKTLPDNQVALDGSGSYDPDGSIATYAWTLQSGPAGSNPAIASPNSSKTNVTGLLEGTYVFQLMVTDDKGATDVNTVTVTVAPAPPANKAPVANAGTDITITLPDNSVTLDGSGSSDPDGTIATYSWVKKSGPGTPTIAGGNTAKRAVTGLVEGSYSFELTVTDDKGSTATATVNVTVKPAVTTPPPPPANKPPVANAGTDIAITLPDNSVTLDGSGSSDPDGTIATYSWVKKSGPGTPTIAGGNTAKRAVTGLVEGSYSFELTVTDDKGSTATATVNVTVKPAVTTPPPPPANKPPVANAGQDQSVMAPVTLLQLDGTSSYDPDGSIAGYGWRQLSGPAGAVITDGSAAAASVSGMEIGTYSFELTVTDNSGAIARDTVKVEVTYNISRTDDHNDVFIYPTLAQDVVNMNMQGEGTGQCEVTVYTINGQSALVKTFEKSGEGQRETLQVSSLQRGVYVMRIRIGKMLKVQKIVKM